MSKSAPSPATSSDPGLAAFIRAWTDAAAHERSNYGLFLTQLCAILDLPPPEPARADDADNAYVFERAVPLHHPDGTTTKGFIDLYRRGCFVLEAKQYADAASEAPAFARAAADAPARRSAVIRGTEAWDRRMLEARGQAENYARNLPASEPPPPFLIALDVGHTFALYADFTQKGKTYLPFPDPRTYRIRLADLTRTEIRERLRAVWLDPQALDPAKKAAAVTREVATHLAELARILEKHHEPQAVAAFLSRCLFCMFAEDIGLLPKQGFKALLDSVQGDPGAAVPLLRGLFEEMNRGGYSLVLREKLLLFNGGLFADAAALPLDRDSLDLLRRASALEWRYVEPAIFGTLLERALEPTERHKLGAHYTPRAYVERLVLPTVIEPLREQWEAVRAAAVTRATRGDMKGAIKEARAFHHELCTVRVLDPACGSGNFLYVTLEHMKRLEGEVLELVESFGDNMRLDLGGETVDPHQFLGLEINTRAATVAELVLWIGYLQWHHRNRGSTEWPEPVLRAFKNIECRDAVLAYDRREPAKDAHGKVRYAWDRRTMKKDPVTGREVPDESAQIPLETFINPRPAEWPQAEFIVGNPPFIGGWMIRQTNGDGYVEALWKAYPEIPEKADYVMYWWNKAARLVRSHAARRFGFITTNSVTQVFQRRVIELHTKADPTFRIIFAVPDHPWVDAADGAAVRIAMTVGTTESAVSTLSEVAAENGEDVTLSQMRVANINSDLSTGVDVGKTVALAANDQLSSPGVQLYGDGFIVDAGEADKLLQLANTPDAQRVIRRYINGRDFMQTPRGVSVIDFFGYDMEQARRVHPQAFERVLTHVKPDRDQNRREAIRRLWWRFGWERPAWREMARGLPRFIVTPETAKHRVFAFLDAEVLPDNMLTGIATDDAFHLGVLSSAIHVTYATAAGGRLGVGNDPRYNKTRCFAPFPFPDCTEKQKGRIRALAEELDAHRKRSQAAHGLGMTDIYNVLEKLRAKESFTPKDRAIHDAALVSTLKQLHDDLDVAVADAYGWPWPLTEAEILERVVALNAERAAEEARGLIRWLRPDYQRAALGATGPTQPDLPSDAEDSRSSAEPKAKGRASRPAKSSAAKAPWPKTLPERSRAVAQALAASTAPITAVDLAKQFARAKSADVTEILETLVALGQARPGSTRGTYVR